MTPRLNAVLSVLLYLLAQASLALHHAELPAACVECTEGAQRSALHCSDEDCGDSSHHHHGHRHHPASCRTCSTDLVQEGRIPALVLVDSAQEFPFADPAAPSGADTLLHRSIRGPPARA